MPFADLDFLWRNGCFAGEPVGGCAPTEREGGGACTLRLAFGEEYPLLRTGGLYWPCITAAAAGGREWWAGEVTSFYGAAWRGGIRYAVVVSSCRRVVVSSCRGVVVPSDVQA